MNNTAASLMLMSVSLLVAACTAEDAHFESGSVKFICGSSAKPCNFKIVAPPELQGAAIYIDGTETVMLFSDDIEHPIQSLLFGFFGIERTSDASIAICHLPVGTHVVRIVKVGFAPIERVVAPLPGRSQAEPLRITSHELRHIATTAHPM